MENLKLFLFLPLFFLFFSFTINHDAVKSLLILELLFAEAEAGQRRCVPGVPSSWHAEIRADVFPVKLQVNYVIRAGVNAGLIQGAFIPHQTCRSLATSTQQ